jgi:hypothetical protein
MTQASNLSGVSEIFFGMTSSIQTTSIIVGSLGHRKPFSDIEQTGLFVNQIEGF